MQNIISNFLGFQKVLSVFPELYNYSSIAPLILRVSLGMMIIKNGSKKENSLFRILNIATGTMLILGLYTQIVATISFIVSFIKIFSTFRDEDKPNHNFGYYFLMVAIAMSLILSGPGAFSLDLPL